MVFDMTPTPAYVRFSVIAAPVLLAVYGALRLVDGMDGDHGPGLAWNVGHVAFFAAFVLLGVLAVGLRQLLAATTRRAPMVANLALLSALFGAACFLWVIAGDLSDRVSDAAPVPDAIDMVGPLAFQIGMLTLLALLVRVRPRRVPVLTPVLVLLGFVVFAVSLDLVPIGALLILAGLAPLRRGAPVMRRLPS